MTPNLLLYNVICVGFFLFALISFFNPTKVNVVANRWFGLFLFSVGGMVLNAIIYDTKTDQSFTKLIAFNELSRFVMAPALYLSVLHFTSPNKTFRRREYLHFIPFLLFFCYMAPVAFISGSSTLGNPGAMPPMLGTVIRIAMLLSIKAQMLIYWLLSWRKLQHHQ